MTVVDIAKHINMHPASATKLFKKICGMSLMHYITQHRIFHAQRLLMSTDMKIVDVALESGYQSASRFYAAFKEFSGLSPQEYRQSVDLRKIPLQRKAGVWKVDRTGAPAAAASAA
jgi:transcriptional regulator GlxA family with amidase domain